MRSVTDGGARSVNRFGPPWVGPVPMLRCYDYACEQSVYPSGIRGAMTNRHKQRIGELQKRQRDEITQRDAGATVRAGYPASIEPDSDTSVRAYMHTCVSVSPGRGSRNAALVRPGCAAWESWKAVRAKHAAGHVRGHDEWRTVSSE